jgi:hypothetical protein
MTTTEHETETRRVRIGKGAGWVAICSCGWEDRSRRERDAAEDDAAAHRLAVYPDDEPGSAMR